MKQSTNCDRRSGYRAPAVKLVTVNLSRSILNNVSTGQGRGDNFTDFGDD
ncbi:MAG: hypothetical protein MJY77_08395 [Bacteroidaceae bacterium]|nr:hypothetical protein [Bacteroidaceae bacterium]